jgi:serine O-acetyltransferase
MSVRNAFQQLTFLIYELRRMNNTRLWRWLSCWFTTPFAVVFTYRLDRFFYLLLGKYWAVIRFLLSPIMFVARPWCGNCEIHYRAKIGRGLRVLHPSLGVVVSAYTIAGEELVLTGGNCIGGRQQLHTGDLVIGNNVNLGANATILGPVKVGDNVVIGAGAVVVNDIGSNETAVGVPARSISA